MVGVPLALGVDISPVRALVQGGGAAMRMSAARFRNAFNASEPLRRALHRYTHGLMAQITQTAACNRFHVVEARLARWLLMTRDRVGSDQFRAALDGPPLPAVAERDGQLRPLPKIGEFDFAVGGEAEDGLTGVRMR